MHANQVTSKREVCVVTTKLQTPPVAGGSAKFKDAKRIQESITSGPERKALLWLASRMPTWINSDHLTILGFVAMFMAGVSYLIARWNPAGLLLATLCLALNWLGDSLDGTIARVRNCQRPRYGFYVDHMIDSFGAIFLMGGLGLSGHVNWSVAMCMLIAFLVLSIESYLTTYTLGIFRLSFSKFGPTEIRILLASANLVLWFHPNAGVPGTSYRLLDLGGLVAAVAMLIMAVVAAIQHTRILYRSGNGPVNQA